MPGLSAASSSSTTSASVHSWSAGTASAVTEVDWPQAAHTCVAWRRKYEGARTFTGERFAPGLPSSCVSMD